ncbi:MAG TPA: carboxypeptidase-like regulatory domain-containing protein, partial [Bryobacteraceae bacterium]|nr:carboxypeptidase-like regulatory domain-containing protein [Bryobacteraceae bacterium]
MLKRIIVAGAWMLTAAFAQVGGQPRGPAMTTPVGTGTISGKVLAAEGGPVRKAAVFLLWNGTPRSTATAITDGAGQFRFDALPPGDYDLRSSREGFGSAVFGATEGSLIGKPIRLASGEQRSGIVLTLVRAASIAGVVRDVDGEPLPGAD